MLPAAPLCPNVHYYQHHSYSKAMKKVFYKFETVIFWSLFIYLLIYIFLHWHHFQITSDPCNLVGSYLFPSLWETFIQTRQPIIFQGLFKVTLKLAKNERQLFKNQPKTGSIKCLWKSYIWAAEFFDFKKDVIKW